MSERWLLPPPWFDFCWEIGGFDEIPFPLSVRSQGATLEERAVLRRQALPDMQAAGLLSGPGLTPRLAQVFAQIAKPELWIEGVWMPDDTSESPARLMSIATVEGALLVVQDPGETEKYGGDLWISVYPRTSLPAATMRGMPPASPGKRPRVAALAADLTQSDNSADDNLENVDITQSVGAQRRDATGAETLRAMTEEKHYRDGQFSAMHQDRLGRTHRSQPFRWFDAFEPDGRYGLTQHQRPGVGLEIVLGPMGPREFGDVLENRINEVRAAR